jgi:hypothetical protein
MKSHMYAEVKTWSPFKGCLFDCVYCKPSFQAQAKRQKHNCMDCYNYVPHYHFERLNHMPRAETVFVCGNGDISFCEPFFTMEIIERVKRYPARTFYFQSKRPEYFGPFVSIFPTNVILLTTLETNMDIDYERISKAPLPTKRIDQFLQLDYPRKGVTIEPIMDFNLDFVFHLKSINPEFVWIGFNSRPKQVQIPEPDEEGVLMLIDILKAEGIEVRGKELRGLTI